MNVMFLTFILGSMFVGHIFGLFTPENVIFQKTNEVFINDAHWAVTFVHDLKPFKTLINQIKSALTRTDEIMRYRTNFYRNTNRTGYEETFIKSSCRSRYID